MVFVAYRKLDVLFAEEKFFEGLTYLWFITVFAPGVNLYTKCNLRLQGKCILLSKRFDVVVSFFFGA